MPVPQLTADDYARARKNLLPRGRAWPRDPDAILSEVMDALSPTYERSGAAAGSIPTDVSPATTTNFVVEWEETLGLPDPCTAPNSTLAQRKAAIYAKFIASGGQSKDYFIAIAKALGFTITITETDPYTWVVHAPAVAVIPFHLGVNICGDPFWTLGTTELECRLRTIMPAHTVLQFQYS
jgi:uncharacterized protein YmfQ (DUF2313 family)